MDDDLKHDYDRLCDLVDRFRTRLEHKKTILVTQEKLEIIIEKIKTNIKKYDRESRKTIRMCIAEFEALRDTNLLFESGEKEMDKMKPKTNDEMLASAKITSKKTTGELKDAMSKLRECEEIGNEAVVIIKIDNDKLEKINQTVDQIGSDLKISQRLLGRFLKRIYTDKLILCFVVIIVLLIIFIILVKYKIIPF